MRKLFCLFGLFVISLSASAAGEWLYYKHYPWVYDNVSKDWLYLRGASGGEVYAYRSSTKEWEVFEFSEPTWEQKYEEWIQNPEPYGGLSVLQQIKDVKDSGATYLELVDTRSGRTHTISDLSPLAGLTNLTELILWQNRISDLTPLAGLTNLTMLDLYQNNISVLTPLTGLTNLERLELGKNNITDLTPLAGLTNLTELLLNDNNISDITPLAGLTNLTSLYLGDNPITASQKAMLEEALPNTNIDWPDVIIDDSQETEKTWEQKYEEWIQNPEPYGGLEVLKTIRDVEESGATVLSLSFNNISDLSPLAGLTNLTYLYLNDNNISDLSPLAGLTNLEVVLWLDNNSITDLTPLAGLTNLEVLYLTFNNITDVTPLAGLTNLTELSLRGNNISDAQKSMLQYGALTNTNIFWYSSFY